MYITSRRFYLTAEFREQRDEDREFPLVLPIHIGAGVKPFAVQLTVFRRVHRRTLDPDGSLRNHRRVSRVELWLTAGEFKSRNCDVVLSHRRWRPQLSLRTN